MKSYKAKSVFLANLGLFRGFWTPFGALGMQRVFRKKNFYSAQLDIKIKLAAKFQKKINGRLSRISPDTRTPLKTMVPLR